ncbi:flagellar basal body P-ring formation chaperone FlgA [Paraburkholderia ferrariae]|uniref:Flagellar basal body P-ring formation chaperone FlgA n=1 Tax=Paraburkholderia ferrariae TaxID=386056 RepID=A0ABU9RML8_9BURK
MLFHSTPARLALILSAVARCAIAASLDVAPAATVNGPDVKLGEIAHVDAPDGAQRTLLSGIDLGPAPRVGFERQVRRSDIERALHAQGWSSGNPLGLSGAQVTVVRVASQQVGSDELLHCATASLVDSLNTAYRNIRLTPLDAPAALALPVGRIDYRARPMDAPRPLPRRMAQWVDISVDGRLYRSVPVTFEIHAQTEALVAGRELTHDEPLAADAASVHDVDAAGVKDKLLPADALAAGLHVRRELPAGTALTWADVGTPPAVARGDWVTLRVGAGAVRIEERVQALEDGQLGAAVHVKSAAGVSLSARVIGSGMVEASGS